ncbi:MAG: hypothetical protein K6A89_02840 [Treponema sp.]|nr:hypothetical protein [Treponema sp.]
MSNLLLIGKDLPEAADFAEALVSSGKQVFAVSKNEADVKTFEAQNIFSAVWNKGSSISTHSLLLNAQNKFEKIDEVIFYFDSVYFASKFDTDKIEEFAPAMESMMTSFLYSSAELLRRVDQKQDNLSVLFLVKEAPSKYEAASQKSVSSAVSTVVSVAQAAFEKIAENFSVNVTDRNYLSVILAKILPNNELYKNDKGIAQWAVSSFEAVAAMKNHQNVKQAGTWNKVGSKIQTGFSLFK